MQGSLFVAQTTWQCIDVSNYGAGPRLDTYSCAHSANQLWERRVSPTCSEKDVTAHSARTLHTRSPEGS